MQKIRKSVCLIISSIVLMTIIFSFPGISQASFPVGAEFLVNTTTNLVQSDASVSMNASGDFIVVWQSGDNESPNPSSYKVYGQRYNADGTTNGSEMLLSDHYGFAPKVSMNDSGDFVVTWYGVSQTGADDGDGYGIWVQRYNSSGSQIGSGFFANTTTIGTQMLSSVSMNNSGKFIITWSNNGDIFGQVYDASGASVGSEFQVNTYTTDWQSYPIVEMNDNGNFLIVWISEGQDGSSTGVFGQVYDASGASVGSEFQVNTYTTDTQSEPSISMNDNGEFVVVWTSNSQGGNPYTIYGQRYDANGATIAGEFLVNTTNLDWQQLSSDVKLGNNGNFVVTWTGASDIFGNDTEIYIQEFDNAGSFVGSEIQINTTTSGLQGGSKIEMNENSESVIVWFGNGTGDDFGIYAQMYDFSNNRSLRSATQAKIPDSDKLMVEFDLGLVLSKLEIVDKSGNLISNTIFSSPRTRNDINYVIASITNPCRVAQEFFDRKGDLYMKSFDRNGNTSLVRIINFDYNCLDLRQAGQGSAPYKDALWVKYYSNVVLPIQLNITDSKGNILSKSIQGSIKYAKNKIDNDQKIISFLLDNPCLVSSEFKKTKKVYLEAKLNIKQLSKKIPINSFTYTNCSTKTR